MLIITIYIHFFPITKEQVIEMNKRVSYFTQQKKEKKAAKILFKAIIINFIFF